MSQNREFAPNIATLAITNRLKILKIATFRLWCLYPDFLGQKINNRKFTTRSRPAHHIEKMSDGGRFYQSTTCS